MEMKTKRAMAVALLAILGVAVLTACEARGTQAAAPASSDSDHRESGRKLYVAHCASCHGQDGQGNGPVAVALQRPPTDLTRLAKLNNGKFPAQQVYASVRGQDVIPPHGSKEMPVWGPMFLAESGRSLSDRERDIQDLVKYIESMQTEVSAGVRH